MVGLDAAGNYERADYRAIRALVRRRRRQNLRRNGARESGPFQCVRYVSPSYLTIVSAAYSNTMTAMIVLAPALALLAIKLHGHTAPAEATEVVVDATPTEGKQPDDAFAQRRTL